MFVKTLSVTALNSYMKRVMDNDFILNNACVKGEISNFKHHSSGHLYFSLKDETSKINCIMFRSSAAGLQFQPENGMKVIVKGNVSVYLKDGAYQLYCNEMEQEGLGELYIKFEQLKKKLEAEGLFSPEHKKTIPPLARRIGVVTSPTGAAVRDIINVVKRRNKSVDVLICPALVQGKGASGDVARAIRELNNRGDVDVIILARGGGSIEELWCFNEEETAYAVYDSKIPVITGIGHETDFTMADFASDRRAPTPSAAAEIATFNLEDMNLKLINVKNYLSSQLKGNIEMKHARVDAMRKELELNSPKVKIANEFSNTDRLKEMMNHLMTAKATSEKERLARLNALLLAHNPLNVLNKGYAAITDCQGKVVSNVQVLQQLEEFDVTLKDGSTRVKQSL